MPFFARDIYLTVLCFLPTISGSYITRVSTYTTIGERWLIPNTPGTYVYLIRLERIYNF
jgi:hypothetical protein